MTSRGFQSTRPRGARHYKLLTINTSLYVSIHAPARGATEAACTDKAFAQFQSTRPRGARQPTASASLLSGVFQSTRPRGARRGHKRKGAGRTGFNPRARAGRDGNLASGRVALPRFNPRARAGRDTSAKLRSLNSLVSIHAPARGATSPTRHSNGAISVSIHAPARGATSREEARPHTKKFQSTRPRGARPCTPPARGQETPVSIHAPARGATLTGSVAD